MAVIDLKSLCVKLNYKFRNIVLLHEALTHKLEETEENEYFSPFPGVLYKQKDYGRLHTLGARVLEHLIVEQAGNQFARQELTNVTLPPNEKITRNFWSFKRELLNPKYFEVVGEQLSLWECIKTTNEFRSKIEAFYEPVIKAILGAIFIDSGGCYGRLGSKVNALQETRNVFLHLWRVTDFEEKATCQLLRDAITENHSFSNIFEGLAKKWSDCSRVNDYDTKLGYRFQQKWLLREILTVQSPENEWKFDILRVVGEAVWELVICEYLYWFYINDDKQTHFKDETIHLYSKVEFYEEIAIPLNLKENLMPMDSGEKALLHLYVKKLIGAIYMDSGCSLATAKKSIIDLCEKNRHKIAKKLQRQLFENMIQRSLPHSTKTYRGTYFHTMDKYCCIVDHGPPKPQDAFKITNVSEFMKVIDHCELEVKADHVDEMGVAEKEEELDFRRIFTGSEDRCNQLEFERVSLYHTLNRMRSDFISPHGDVMMTEHTYGKCLCKNKDVTPYCSEVPEVKRPLKLTQEYGVISNPEFMVALKVVFIWIFMWLGVITKQVKKVVWILLKIFQGIWILWGCGYLTYILGKKMMEGLIWVGNWIANHPRVNVTAAI